MINVCIVKRRVLHHLLKKVQYYRIFKRGRELLRAAVFYITGHDVARMKIQYTSLRVSLFHRLIYAQGSFFDQRILILAVSKVCNVFDQAKRHRAIFNYYGRYFMALFYKLKGALSHFDAQLLLSLTSSLIKGTISK